MQDVAVELTSSSQNTNETKNIKTVTGNTLARSSTPAAL